MSTNIITKLLSFGNKPIRSTVYEGKVYWSIVDILRSVLREDQDSSNTWSTIKKRDNHILAICQNMKLKRVDGRFHYTDCATEEGIFRILQSVNSEKVEDFKLWLAKVGKERLDEEINPELAIRRGINTYKKRGMSNKWINERIKGIDARNTLTDTWKEHGIKGYQYSVLTDDLHQGVFNKKTAEHKKELSVPEKGNLRDHLSDVELAIINLSETMARSITIERNSQGFNEVKKDVKEGSAIGADALSKYKKLINQ